MSKVKRIKIHLRNAFLIFIFGFISLEGVLWYLEINNTLVEPYEWGNRDDIAFKINDCSKLFSNPKHKDKIKVLIIGDSGPLYSFNPRYFDYLSNKKTISYNLAFGGSAVRVHSVLISKVIIPKLKPDIIIWDLSSPNDFQDEERINAQENNTLSTPMGRYYTDNTKDLNFEETCEYYIFKYFRIYRYRKTLRSNMFYSTQDSKNIESYYSDLYDRGWMRFSKILSVENGTTKEVFHDFKLHKKSEELFYDTIKTLEKNTDFFLVVNKAFLFEKGIYPIIYSIFNKLSPKNFLDLNGNEMLFDPYLWWNEGHLNENGALLYTQLVYEKIIAHYEI